MKTFIFDAYGTLISTGTGSLDAARKILALQEKDISAEEFYADWKRYHRRNLDKANAGQFVKEEEIFRQDLEQLYEAYGISRDSDRDVQIMLETLGKRRCFHETLSVIEALRKSHRVVIGSTTDRQPLYQDLEGNDLVVDAVYTSEDIGKYKPAAEFYRYILEREKCSAEDAVFVGDSYVDDVCGPMKVGIRAILVDRKHSFYSEGKEILPWKVVDSLEWIREFLKERKRNQGI